MKHSKMKWTLLVLALAAIVVVGGCKKKQAPAAAPVPPPPAPTQPKATLSVSPESIERGGSATLTWSTQDATTVTLDGAPVATSGSQKVTPTASTTYRITATGAGGSVDATARLTVVEPPPVAKAVEPTDEELFAKSVKDIYFDYDRYDLRDADKAAVEANAAFFKAHPSFKFTIEGHCDERGSSDYNLALGDNRANAARKALIAAGISADQIKVISYGKERPFCNEQNEACYQQNRRDHFVFGQK